MVDKSERRIFDPASIPGLSNKAREAVGALFEAMSSWQAETKQVGEKNSKQLLDKIDTGVAALVWPEQIIEASRTQLRSIGEMHAKTLEHISQAWEEQIKSPNSTMVSL